MVFFYKANQLDKFEGSGSHQNGGTRAISRYGETLRNLEIKSTFSPVGMDFNTYKCNNFHLKTAMLYSNMNSIYHVGVPMYFRKTTYRYIITSSGFSAWKCHNYLLMCKENVPIHFKKKRHHQQARTWQWHLCTRKSVHFGLHMARRLHIWPLCFRIISSILRSSMKEVPFEVAFWGIRCGQNQIYPKKLCKAKWVKATMRNPLVQ